MKKILIFLLAILVAMLFVACPPSNDAPTATNVSLSGTLEVGETLTGSYTYSDADEDPEGTSTFKWYRADDNTGTNETEITGATSMTYDLVTADADKYVCFEVTPVASTGVAEGTPVKSDYSGPIIVPNDAPTATGVAVTGTLEIGETLTGSYTYNDNDSDPEGTSTFKWYRADDSSGTNEEEITGEVSTTYTITSADAFKFICFEVTPIASSGITDGTPVKSDYTDVIMGPAVELTVGDPWIGGAIYGEYMREYYFTASIGSLYRILVDDNSTSTYSGINTPEGTLDAQHKAYKIAGAGDPSIETYDYTYTIAYDATITSGWYDSDFNNNAYVEIEAEETTVYVAVRDYNYDGGTGTYYIMVEEIIPPNPPTGLTIDDTTLGQLDLSWTAPTIPPTNGYYNIFRALDDGGSAGEYSLLGSTADLVTVTYTDDTVELGETYWYQVTTYDSDLEKDSDYIEASATEQTAKPEPATNLVIDDTTLGQLDLSWTAPTTPPANGTYNIYRALDEGGSPGIYESLGSTTDLATVTYTDDTVSVAVTYWYRVRVYDSDNDIQSDHIEASGTEATVVIFMENFEADTVGSAPTTNSWNVTNATVETQSEVYGYANNGTKFLYINNKAEDASASIDVVIPANTSATLEFNYHYYYSYSNHSTFMLNVNSTQEWSVNSDHSTWTTIPTVTLDNSASGTDTTFTLEWSIVHADGATLSDDAAIDNIVVY